jgi:hypothetical protein
MAKTFIFIMEHTVFYVISYSSGNLRFLYAWSLLHKCNRLRVRASTLTQTLKDPKKSTAVQPESILLKIYKQ